MASSLDATQIELSVQPPDNKLVSIVTILRIRKGYWRSRMNENRALGISRLRFQLRPPTFLTSFVLKPARNVNVW
jgi:hypothetical protein